MSDAGDSPRPRLARNPVSLFGAWVTTVAALAFAIYVGLDSFGWLRSPYAGLFGFVVVPIVFVAGLALVLLGIWREARRRQRGTAPWAWPVLDLRVRHTRAIVALVGVLSLVNLGVVSLASVGAVRYTESDEFCGEVCHEPMRPEFTAHQIAPHTNIPCVGCHVAPHVKGVLSAKVNGVRQLYLFATGRFATPIPEPVGRLPPAADTCEQCHTPGFPARGITRTIHEYADDASSTETVTTLVMHADAIHWHARHDVKIEYVATDAVHQTIPAVRVTDEHGHVSQYVADGTAAPPAGAWHQMDCLDCHNRPAHRFSPTAVGAVDAALASNAANRRLPFLHREMVAALSATGSSTAAAVAGIDQHFANAYRGVDPGLAPDVAQAAAVTQAIYSANIFPEMKVTWGTYPVDLGHTDSPGCFRCHDGAHRTSDGRVISQDCTLCHAIE